MCVLLCSSGRYLSQYGVQPHVAVGFEGIWGFLACMILLPIMKQIKNSKGVPFDDLATAIEQIKASRPLLYVPFPLSLSLPQVSPSLSFSVNEVRRPGCERIP